jgi:hypothetical protein
VVGITFAELARFANLVNLASGTGTNPTFGSIVQNGKLADSAPALLSALKSVDFPTFGKPTMPHFKLIVFTCVS